MELNDMRLSLTDALMMILDSADALEIERLGEILDLSAIDPHTGPGAAEWISHPRFVQLCADMIRKALGDRAPTLKENNDIHYTLEMKIDVNRDQD